MDFKEAFDTVSPSILFLKLVKAGIQGKIFKVIRDLFSSNPANVHYLSPEFEINHGVLQGSKLGPILFNLFANDLLKELEISGLGAAIGTVNVPALAFADYIVLISDDHNKLQKLINLCQKWAENNGMAFRTDKCKVMVFNGSPKSFEFKLYGDILEIVESHNI